MKDALEKLYRDGTSDKTNQVVKTGSDVDAMVTFMQSASDKISTFKKEQSNYEAMIDKILKKLSVLSSKSKSDAEAATAKNASKISSLCSALINVYRIATNAQISAYKACNRQYSSALRKFLRSGFMAESVLFEGDDVDDIDLDDDDVVEAAVGDADDPVGDPDDIGVAGVSECDGKDLLEAAMRYI